MPPHIKVEVTYRKTFDPLEFDEEEDIKTVRYLIVQAPEQLTEIVRVIDHPSQRILKSETRPGVAEESDASDDEGEDRGS